MKSNEVIEFLKQIALYKNAPLTQAEVDALDYAISCIEQHQKFGKDINVVTKEEPT